MAGRNADSVLPKLFSGEKDLAKPRLTFVFAFCPHGEGVGGIPPAEPSQFRSDIFKQTPHFG